MTEEPDQADGADALPEDLQPGLVDYDEYLFPNNNRRRVPGIMYQVIGVVLVALYLVRGDGVFVNRGLMGAGILLVVFGTYSVVAGWNLNVDERDALVAAVDHVGFPVGHAAAQMGWRCWLSRPTWRVLIYSAEDQPQKRGLIVVDGVNAEVVEALVEDNPEDWSGYEDGDTEDGDTDDGEPEQVL